MTKDIYKSYIQISKKHRGSRELVGSALAFSLMTVCVKNLQGRIPVAEIVFTRAIISLFLTRYMLYKENINPWGINKKLLFLRGVIGTGALICIFKALEILPLASATIIQYTYPTFASLAAWIFLKETINRKIILALIVGWVGITLVVQPTWLIQNGSQIPINYVYIALCGALLTALAYICVRKLSKNEHPLVIIHYFPLISIPITIPSLLTEGVLPIGMEWFWLIGIGIFTQIGQIGITKGLCLLPAARASAINYSQVLFATIWGMIIFSEPINEYVALGAILILAATIISISSKEENSLKLN